MIIDKLKKHQKIFLFSIALVTIISLLDICFMTSNLFAEQKDYILGNYAVGLWDLFFKVGIAIIIASSLGYYFFNKKHDKSETLALFVSSLSLWILFGLSDILFFLFRGVQLPTELPWLDCGFIGKISSLFGVSHVTDISLLVLCGAGLIINYFLIKILVKRF